MGERPGGGRSTHVGGGIAVSSGVPGTSGNGSGGNGGGDNGGRGIDKKPPVDAAEISTKLV